MQNPLLTVSIAGAQAVRDRCCLSRFSADLCEIFNFETLLASTNDVGCRNNSVGPLVKAVANWMFKFRGPFCP
jgi:hypothetical protein